VRRRDLLLAGAALVFGNVLEDPQSIAYAAAPDTTSAPFSSQTVRQLARELAQKPYHPPDATVLVPARLTKGGRLELDDHES